MASKTVSTPVAENLNIRAATRYLQDHGVDIGEMRMRSLIRQHPVFTTPSVAGDETSAGAFKAKTGNSEIETWEIKPSALDAYVTAVQSGTVRNSGNGKKFYRIQLDGEQLSDLRAYASGKGYADFERANKNQGGKGKSKAKTNGAAAGESLEGLLADMDEEDTSEADETEA